jgi:hypothetical protein
MKLEKVQKKVLSSSGVKVHEGSGWNPYVKDMSVSTFDV